MVEVFKTTVQDEKESLRIINLLQKHFPEYFVNFDLEDCDKILRIENREGFVNYEEVIALANARNILIRLLD